jgi:hypothetical protein
VPESPYTHFQNSISHQEGLREQIINLIKENGARTELMSPLSATGPYSPRELSPSFPSTLLSPTTGGRNLRAPYPERVHPDRVKALQKQLIEKKRRANQSQLPSGAKKEQAPGMLLSMSKESLGVGDLNSPSIHK